MLIDNMPPIPANMDPAKVADYFKLIHSLGVVHGSNPNAKVSPEHMQLIMQAMKKAGMPPELLAMEKGKSVPPPAISSPPPGVAAISPGAVTAAAPSAAAPMGQWLKPPAMAMTKMPGGRPHKDEPKAQSFLYLLDVVLRPVFNQFDQKAAAQVRRHVMLCSFARVHPNERSPALLALTDCDRFSRRLFSSPLLVASFARPR